MWPPIKEQDAVARCPLVLNANPGRMRVAATRAHVIQHFMPANGPGFAGPMTGSGGHPVTRGVESSVKGSRGAWLLDSGFRRNDACGIGRKPARTPSPRDQPGSSFFSFALRALDSGLRRCDACDRGEAAQHAYAMIVYVIMLVT